MTPKFDNLIKSILEDLDYPEAMGKDVDSYRGESGWKGKIVKMSPQKFLSLAAPLPERLVNHKSIENLLDRYEKQLPVDPLVLQVDMETNKVIGHEGRHRALAAIRKGITVVPVLIFTGSYFKRVPNWDAQDHSRIDAAEFEPEKSGY